MTQLHDCSSFLLRQQPLVAVVVIVAVKREVSLETRSGMDVCSNPRELNDIMNKARAI